MAAIKKSLSNSKINSKKSSAKGKSSKPKAVKDGKKTVSVVKAATAPKKLPPLEKISKAFNKSLLISTLAERVGVSRKHVALILEDLFHIIGLHVKKGGPEKFVFPGAFKIVVRKTAAKKARPGINPFTGEKTIFKAKPAARKVKIIPLKTLKDLAI